MRILVLNSGSSSIKYQVLETSNRSRAVSGQIERIGSASGRLTQSCGNQQLEQRVQVVDHRAALALALESLAAAGVALTDLDAIAHRVVHGGSCFRDPVRIDAGVMERLRAAADLAPLHMPPNVLGMEVATELAPDLPQVAVFDTAFHQHLPPRAYTYALPAALRQEGIRRYGFHGSSHAYVARAAAAKLARPLAELRLITLHLGNGASVAAIKDGHSIDTSMGLTPLEGLVMGTRSGDLDPAIVLHLARKGDLDADGIEGLLTRESGLLGLCGESDMRVVLQRAASGDGAAALAVDVFCYRVRKYIGAYMAVLGGLDALVFTAGIGEHAEQIRWRCCEGLETFGIVLDAGRNSVDDGAAREISTDEAAVRVLVVPTDEELEIALAAAALLQG